MFDRVLNLTMGRAKYLQQLQMQLSKKATVPDAILFPQAFTGQQYYQKHFDQVKVQKP